MAMMYAVALGLYWPADRQTGIERLVLGAGTSPAGSPPGRIERDVETATSKMMVCQPPPTLGAHRQYRRNAASAGGNAKPALSVA